MQMRMYIREWRGVDLTKLPAARDARTAPAGPEMYKQFYEAVEARSEDPDHPAWARRKVRLGERIAASILREWQQQHGRKPRILAVGVGHGFSEGVWLEQGWDVTVQEVQEVSLSTLVARFPYVRTVIGDIRQLTDLGQYDIITMLALDYVLTRDELKSVYAKLGGWVAKEGWVLVSSVSVLSIRQWAAEVIKAISGRPRPPDIFWGYWRTPGEFRRIAADAGLRFASAYLEPELEKRRFASGPLLRRTSLLMLFQRR